MIQDGAQEVTEALRGMDFPCTKQDLLARARRGKAAPGVIRRIENLPDHQFNNMAEVVRGLGGAH